MTRRIVPHSQIDGGVHTGAGGQPLCSGPRVVAAVGVASHDGAEIARWFSPQAERIDELGRAVGRLQHVEVVAVAVYEHGASVVVGAAATVHPILAGHGPTLFAGLSERLAPQLVGR
jgi:hypothetical protein